MIEFVPGKFYSDEDPVAKALNILDVFDPAYMSWAPNKTFNMLIATPASVAEHFRNDIDLCTKYLTALTGGKSLMIHEVVRGDAYYLEFSGEGTAEIARLARDTLHKNFAGSANIPSERKKG